MERSCVLLMGLFLTTFLVVSSDAARGHPSKKPVIRSGTQIWCIAKPNADASVLQNGLNFACGEGGADCTAIQPNGRCYNPNNLLAHASYAFNSYYQRKGRNYWNCYFQNAALLVVTDPSYGSCTYPSVG